MPSPFRRRVFILSILIGIISAAVFGIDSGHLAAAQSGSAPQPPDSGAGQAVSASSAAIKIYLPGMFNDFPWISTFGAETVSPVVSESSVYSRTVDLKLGWVRLGNRISWRRLQPNPGESIHWELLASFENELKAIQSAGINPIVVIYDTPLWAADGRTGNDGKASTCSAIRTERFADFAAFLRAVIDRYQAPEFNVHNWELGNEPDVDPKLVPADSGFGCWGDESDPYYGGRHYGEMLKAVAPAIRAEDPRARIWLGGLLLAAPQDIGALQQIAPGIPIQPVFPELLMRGVTTPYSSSSHPELFFKGILEAGAAPSFDILAYHWYPSYYPFSFSIQNIDYDLWSGQTAWDTTGGGVVGKANYLRKLMAEYGVDKPLFLNEIGLGCMDTSYWCKPPDDSFYQAQADFVPRAFVRGLSQNIAGISWYTMENPGWRYLGLLDDSYNPKPVYRSYQQLTSQLQNARYVGPVIYGDCIEAYTFRKGSQRVQIAWAKGVIKIQGEFDYSCVQTFTISIPQSKFVEARSRDGVIIPPVMAGSDVHLTVGFSPIYITMLP